MVTSYYRRGTFQYGILQECGALSRFQLGIVGTTNTNGGSGGAGGKGQGYVSANASGSGALVVALMLEQAALVVQAALTVTQVAQELQVQTVTEQMVLVVLVVAQLANTFEASASLLRPTTALTLAVQHDAR